MRTNKCIVMSLLAAVFLGSCSNEEEPAVAGQGEAIQVSAGIGEATRAVINTGYGKDLAVSFARMDNPGSSSNWTALDAVRAAGSGNTSITFSTTQTYSGANVQSALIGYHPRAVLANSSNPATVSYTITGDEDIMATEVLTGSANAKFTTPFTFQHLLTQLQFKCIGSTDAINKWTAISSIKVKNVYNTLSLSLNKTGGATLSTTGSANTVLDVIDYPKVVSTPDAADLKTGHLMLYPVADMGTQSAPINLEVKATYNGMEKTVQVPISNISGGAQKGQSHLITLNFTIDGEIAIEAGIAEWQPGNGGSSTITP